MLINKRPDGNPLKVPGYTRLLPILMPTRTESTIFMEDTWNLDKTLAFISNWNESLPEGRRKLTVMQVLLTGVARTIAVRPALNRFISNYRYYQRNNISVSFVAKKTLSDNGAEVNVIMPFRPDDILDDVNERFTRYVDQAKSDEGNKTDEDVILFEKLPIFLIRTFVWLLKFLDRRNWIPKGMIRMLPFYSSIFLTNVGSLKLDAPFHHNYEIGNTGIFIALGRTQRVNTTHADGSVHSKATAKVTYTFDDRIVDGIYSGRAMKYLKELVENPQKLVEKPTLHSKHTAELNLSEKGWDLWAMKEAP